MRVTAAVMEEKSSAFKLDSLELDTPRPDEVLVKITATGICHTDLHARDGYFAMPYPAVYGHEGAGIVAAVGSAVEYLVAGDHVVMSFPWCGGCEHCREDRRSYCRRGRELKSSGARADGSTTMRRNRAPVYGSFFQQSSFATYALTTARNAVKVRRDAPIEFLGPLGCGLQTGAGAVLNVMQPEAGKSFVVFGAGSVGLAGLMAAKLARCEPIIAVDIRANRLQLARSLGATHTIDNVREDAVATIREITGGGVHFALETSALPAVFRQAVDCLLTRGTCVLVGSARRGVEVSFEMSTLQAGRIVRGVIQGDSRPDLFIPHLVDLFVAGRFPIDRLVTFYDFASINQAVADAVNGRTIKPVLRMPQ
ncbi:MAG: NAD(P)-dependent alcohol dehydrogenase [Alphaproteobacteria bacterium]|nr:NAD(P)-dependent alcohol dehydrogenase [Alphaproteobacteria bacterium]